MKLKILTLCMFSYAFAQGQQIYNVQDNGAKNDGQTVNTLSIQKAIDRCSSAGGGRVVFNSGTFLSGTLYLKSNVELYLGAGAVLKGVADMSQYTAVPTGKRSALINAFEQDNIAILGPGKIDGSGDNKVFQGGDKFNGLDGRPHLVHFRKCSRVRMKEFTAVNSAFWTLKIEECTQATIDDIKVRSRVVANNDGLDIVDCHNVTVSNSYFDCGDDGICPKSDGKMGVKNLVITNCMIKSESNGIKFGTTGIGGFEDVTVSNCVIYDTRLSGLAFEMVDGGTMDRIVVNNITMHRVNGGIFIKLGQRSGSKPGILRNISISNVIADGVGAWRPDVDDNYHKAPLDRRIGMTITGQPGFPVENVTLSNIYMQFAGGGKKEDAGRIMADKPAPYPEYSNYGITPAYGLNCRYVKNLKFFNLQLDYVQKDVRPALFFDEVTGLAIDNLQARVDPAAMAFIRLKNVNDVFIRNNKPQAVDIPYLFIEDTAKDVTVINNDFRKLKEIYRGQDKSKPALINTANNLLPSN